MRCALAVILSGVVIFGGCKSSTEEQFEAEQTIIGPPMEHDPTDRVELARWWSNDSHLLRLDENAAYVLYQGTNRYTPPIERGRWAKQSYALLWLEPYNTMKVDPRRVTITKVDGKLALVLPDSKPMFALKGPPPVIEDQLIGAWQGPMGSLELLNDLRYTLLSSIEPSTPGTTVCKGSWHVVDNALVLQPDKPDQKPMRLPLVLDDKQVTIAVDTSAPGDAAVDGGVMTKSSSPAIAVPHAEK